MGGIFQTHIENQGHDRSGKQRRNCYAQNTHVQSKDADSIARYIQNVANDRGVEGDAGLTHSTKQGSVGVIYAQKRVGDGGNRQISQRCVHDICFDGAKKEADKLFAQKGSQERQNSSGRKNSEHNLL